MHMLPPTDTVGWIDSPAVQHMRDVRGLDVGVDFHEWLHKGNLRDC